MTTAQVLNDEATIATPHLLVEVKRTYPELQAQDAFVLPTWFYQQNSWLKDSWYSENALYNYPIALQLRGPLDEEILRRSLGEVRRRHHVLRSVLRIMNGRLIHIVVPPQPVDLMKVDLSGVEESARDARLFQLILEEAHRPFDLTRETPLRVTLVHVGDENEILLLNTHHLVCDDWSVGILIRELSALYHSFSTGTNERIPELSFQYGDFIRRWEQRPNNETRRSRCKATLLGGSKTFHHLRTDFPLTSPRSRRGTTVKYSLPKYLETDLKLLSQQHHVTFFMTMLAGFQCLLNSYSGDEDVAVGTCAANRPLPAVGALIGRFANDLLVRTNLSGNPTFDEVLARTRAAALGSYSYQDVPFGGVLEEVVSVADPSRTPLFQLMFILQNAPRERPRVGKLTIERISLDTQTSKYDLTVWLRVEEGVEIAFEYNPDLFKQETIQQLIRDYETVLKMMAADSAQHLSDIEKALSLVQHSLDWRTRVTADAPECTGQRRIPTATNLEPELLTIWRELLGLDEIGVKDDFFQLGGDSLRATQLLNRVEHKFGISLDLDMLLVTRTIQQQAMAIAQQAVRPAAEKTERCAALQATQDVRPTDHEHVISAEPRNTSIRGNCRKSLFRRSLNRILHILCRFSPGATTLRPFLHRLRGVQIGKKVWIGDDVYLENEYPECVEIHDGAMVGMRSTIVAHTRGPGKIVIGENAFVGVGCVIVTSGNRRVVIGEGAVIMASSLVSANVAPFTLYGSDSGKALAKITKPFTDATSYDELIASFRPLQK